VKSYCENQKRIFDITPGDVNVREVLRYAKCRDAGEVEQRLIDECVAELGEVKGRVCAIAFPVKRGDSSNLDLGFCKLDSKDLCKCLKNCDEIVLFAATIGMEIDRLIRKYSHLSPARALIFQALGAERIEAVCDAYCKQMREELADEGLDATPRFSPGYGDVGLEVQRDIFRVLDCQKSVGISLGENLFMQPSKSVTAIVGVKRKQV